MNIVLFTRDSDLIDWANGLDGAVSTVETCEEFAETIEEILTVYEDEEDEEEFEAPIVLAFMDYDFDRKQIEKVNKSIKDDEDIIRILVTSQMSVKELKKHQKGKTATHGYLMKPLTDEIFKGILEDLELTEEYEAGDGAFATLARAPEGFDEEDKEAFEPSEMKVNTVVKNILSDHSSGVKDRPYESDLNDEIQKKFDYVFGANSSEADFELRDDFNDDLNDEISLDEDDASSIATDIEIDLDTDLESELDELTANRELPEDFDPSSDQTGDINIDGLDDAEDDVDFSLDDADEVDEIEDIDPIIEPEDPIEESDSPELNLSEEDDPMSDENDNLDLDEDILEFEDEALDELESGELSFSEPEEGELEMGDDTPESESVSDGGLDFDFADDSGEEGALEIGAAAEQVDTGDDGGLDLGAGGDDDFALDLGAGDASDEGMDLSAAEDLEGSSLAEDSLDLGGDEAADDEEDILSFEEDSEVDVVGGIEGVDDAVAMDAPSDDSDIDAESNFEDDELSFEDDDGEELDKTEVFSADALKADSPATEMTADDNGEDELLDLGDDSDDEAFDLGDDAVLTADDDSLDVDMDEGLDEDETDPTMLMTKDVTEDLEAMIDDDEISTREFRPGEVDDEFDMSESSFSVDESFEATATDEIPTDLDDDLDDIEDPDMTASIVTEMDSSDDEVEEEIEEVQAPVQKSPSPSEVPGHLNITKEEDRIPPSFHEGEAVRLQATIRQLRQEREELLKEMELLRQDVKVLEQDNLGLKAELDETKIELTIVKKRHSSEVEEMSYRLRVADEKKLFAEEKAKTLQKDFDRLQQKVRMDFNQIKVREKELEGQLELVKMDTEAQVQSRDKKILELKRKIDQLEFNMENVVIKEQKSRDDKMKLEERLERIMKTLRGSIEVLEDDLGWENAKNNNDKDSRKP